MHTVIRPPEQEPVTVTELAQNLMLVADSGDYTGNESDKLLQLIQAARADAEHYTGRYFAMQAVRHAFPFLRKSMDLHTDTQSIDVVKYYDQDNNLQEINQEDYFSAGKSLQLKRTDFKLYQRPDALQVDCQVGQNMNVLPDIKRAILLIASHWYENREATTPLNVRQVPAGLS